MIQTDAHHHGDIRIDDVDRIQSPAHADLEYPGVQLRRLEQQQGRQGIELKKRQRHGAARRFDFLKRGHQCGSAGMSIMNANALAIVAQVR